MLGHGALGELALGQIPAGGSGVTEKDVSDAVRVAASDTIASISVLLSRTDGAAIVLDDSVAALDVTLSRSDELRLALADTLAILADVTVADALGIALADMAGVVVPWAVSDALPIALAEGVPSIASVMAVSDALDISLADAASVFIRLDLDDALTIALIDFLTPAIRQPPRSAIGSIGAGSISGGIRAARPLGGYGSGRADGKIGH